MLYKDLNSLTFILKEIEQENNEELIYLFKYFFQAFLKSTLTFGLTHKITKDALNLLNQFRYIVKEEKKLHSFIIKEGKKIDKDECMILLEKLQDLNEKTILYYYKAYNDILDACNTKCEDRATHLKKDFKTLIETEEYRNILLGLTLTLKDVKKHLNFEEEFWQYIDDKTTIINSKNEMEKCGIKEKNEKIEIFVPLIINKETANINKEIFNAAHEILIKKKELKNKNL